MALLATALAVALLMASTASAQLTTTTSGTGYWVVTTGTTGRWLQSGTAVNDTGNWVAGSDATFADAGTYTFGRLVATGSATLGNITTGTGVFISFSDTTAGNVMSFGNAVKTFDFGAGSVVNFGGITCQQHHLGHDHQQRLDGRVGARGHLDPHAHGQIDLGHRFEGGDFWQ